MSTPRRQLRLGIVWQGRLLREAMAEPGQDVTVGTARDCTVRLEPQPDMALPDRTEILLHEFGELHAVEPAGADATVRLRGGRPTPEARFVRGRRCLSLDGATGGTWTQGDLTVLFQLTIETDLPLVARERTVLRLGLVHDERLLCERIFAGADAVAVGRDRRDALVLPGEEYAGPSLRFEPRPDGAVTVVVPAGLDVVLAEPDGPPRALRELVRSGRAQVRGDVARCPVGLESRGRARLGPYTVLFQVVRQSLVVAQPPRRSLARRAVAVVTADRTWSTSLLVALLLVGAVVAQAVLYHRATGRYLRDVAPPEQVTRGPIEVDVPQLEPVPVVEPPPLQPPEPAPAPAPRPTAEPTPHKIAPKARVAEARPQAEPAPSDTRTRLRERTVASALVGATGAPVRLFQDAGPGEAAQVQKVFGGTRDETAGPGTPTLALPRHQPGDTERLAEGPRVLARDRQPVGGQPGKIERKPPRAPVPEPIDPTLPPEQTDVARYVARKAAAVRRCYDEALRDEPDLEGKVLVRFTIGGAGTVTDVEIAGAHGGLADCIRRKFLAFRGLPALDPPRSFRQAYVFSRR